MLKEFRFLWCDAWGGTEYGIDTILETGLEGQTYINMLVAGKPYTVSIDEKKLIEDLERIRIYKWNLNEYHRGIEDGDMWKLSIKYNDIEIMAKGFNGYPPKFLEFLDILHSHGFPEIPFEKYVTTRAIGQSKKVKFEKDAYTTYVDPLATEIFLGEDWALKPTTSYYTKIHDNMWEEPS